MSIDVNVQNDLVIVTESSEDITVNVSNAAGPAGQGVPVGGTTGQVLKKQSGTDYDTFWALDGVGVPYSGATGNVDLGDNDLEAGSVFVEGAAGAGGALRIKQFGSSAANLDGYSTISTLSTGVFYFTAATTSPNFKNFVLNPSGITDNILRTYTLPNLDGTLALLSDIPSLTGFVPYTGATTNVDLGTHRILAQNATIASSGSGDTFTLNHSSGSGIGLNITKGGNGEGLYVNKTGGSGNAATIIGTLNATTLVKSGGTSSQFLKADGSVDSTTYVGGSGATGQVAYWNGMNSQTGSNNLFWDAANSRLGIGTNAPAYGLDVNSNARFTNGEVRFAGNTNYDIIRLNAGTTTSSSSSFVLAESWSGVTYRGLILVNYNASHTSNQHNIPNSAAIVTGSESPNGLSIVANAVGAPIKFWTVTSNVSTQKAQFFGATGNLVLQNGGTFTDAGFRLDVQGTARVSGNLTAASFIRSGGTSAQILAADGSVITAGTNITISGGTISSSGGGGTTIYTGDGTLAGNRTVTTSTFSLTFIGSNNYNTKFGSSNFANQFVWLGVNIIPAIQGNDGTFGASKDLALQPNGSNVGINNTAPTEKLDVNGNITIRKSDASGNILKLNNTAAGAKEYWILSTGAANTPGAGTLSIFDNTSLAYRMVLTSAGRLLLNTVTESTFLLDVNGTARVSGEFTSATATISGRLTTTGYAEVSSASGSNSSYIFSKGGAISTMWQLYTEGSNNLAIFRNGVNRELFKIFDSSKNVGIDDAGSINDIASAKLFVNSTTKGFLPPRMTTTQKNAIGTPAAGLVVYDTDTNKLCCYNGSTWNDLF